MKDTTWTLTNITLWERSHYGVSVFLFGTSLDSPGAGVGDSPAEELLPHTPYSCSFSMRPGSPTDDTQSTQDALHQTLWPWILTREAEEALQALLHPPQGTAASVTLILCFLWMFPTAWSMEREHNATIGFSVGETVTLLKIQALWNLDSVTY